MCWWVQDGAAFMTGIHHGIVKQIQQRAEQAKWTHCFLHRENLATRQMLPVLNNIMSVVVKTVNYIKSALHSRCFAALCNNLDTDHLQLLYHSEVRWLSKGQIPNHLFELRCQVYMFLQDQCSPLAEQYIDDYFCAKLAYLTDIFDQLNQLNMSMQGRNSLVFLVADKVEGFKKNINFWKRKVKDKQFDMLPLLSETLKSTPHVDVFK